MHTAVQQFGTKGFGQIGVCTTFVSFFFILDGIFGCEQDDGDMAGAYIFFHQLAEFDAVHFRHHDVADDDVRNIFLCLL